VIQERRSKKFSVCMRGMTTLPVLTSFLLSQNIHTIFFNPPPSPSNHLSLFQRSDSEKLPKTAKQTHDDKRFKMTRRCHFMLSVVSVSHPKDGFHTAV
jgi:hypothetical protein